MKKKWTLPFAVAALTFAQAPPPEKKPAFEVASIRPAKDDGSHDSDTDKGRFVAHNLTLKRLIAIGYEIDIRRISGGSNWADSDGFDINAKIPAEFAQRTHDAFPQMVQSLLADRFQLVIHREPAQISGYFLLVAKKGPKMQHAAPDQAGSSFNGKNAHLTANSVTMEAFARNLSRNRDLGKMVVDKTGLADRFNFELDWMPERLESRPDASAGEGPSIFTALQEQLGLKLESARVPFEALVIDNAEKPEAN